MSGYVVNCSAQYAAVQPNPDVSGIGVLISFLFSAYCTFFILFANYVLVFDPTKHPLSSETIDHPNPIDTLLLGYVAKWIPQRSSSVDILEPAFEKLVVMLSDQQLITGLALLISSAIQLRSGISSYHWQMTIYLVWFSSFTHLATLTLLRKYLKDNSVLKWTRLFAMSVLIGLLIFALVPTGSRIWLEEGYSLGVSAINAGVPALCFLRFQVPGSHFGGEQGTSVIFSIMVLFLSYATRVVKMFSWSSKKARFYFRTSLGNPVKRLQRNLYEGMQRSSILRWMFFIPYWAILSLVIVIRACLDSFESMIWDIVWLLFALLWGSFRLFGTRDPALSDENVFGFGQCLSIAMLSLFILNLVEVWNDTAKASSEGEAKNAESGSNTDPKSPHKIKVPAAGSDENFIEEQDVDEMDISSLPLLPTHSYILTKTTSSRPRTTSTLSVEERALEGAQSRQHAIGSSHTAGSQSPQTKRGLKTLISIVTPPHEQDFYRRSWYRGLIGLIFIQVLFLSTSILSGALSSTNNLLSTDIRDIRGIFQDVELWVTFYCPLSLFIYLAPFLVWDFTSAPKWGWLTRLRQLIRNEVYKLLFVSNINLRICSPLHRRKRQPPQLDFTRLLLVNKQINAEAKTIFYSLNTFIIGNRDWASREQPNIHALKAFISRVPKACISIIAKITIEMRFYRQLGRTWVIGPIGWMMSPPTYQVNGEDVVQLQSLARSVVKHFTGVEFIEISTGLSPPADLRGDYGRAVKAVGKMLTLPNLKLMTFRGELDPFIEQLIKENEARREIITIIPHHQQL
ncbi:hypothetical protein N431DRAFT_487371 [Stipitochalara longipes BDJ]|nr:hypothetical protein N431DRAFT_487371 [Stipitochalara longipes BDJ]